MLGFERSVSMSVKEECECLEEGGSVVCWLFILCNNCESFVFSFGSKGCCLGFDHHIIKGCCLGFDHYIIFKK